MRYNTAIVLVGTLLLGFVAGVVGVLLLLRKRPLISDAISHATLPGIAIGYLILSVAFGVERTLGGLLVGALISAGIAMALFVILRLCARYQEDASIAIILSSFFGLGVVLLGIIQKLPTGHAAGLQSYIYGDSATLLQSDVLFIAIVGIVVLLCAFGLFKEINIVAFQQQYAQSVGYRVQAIDGLVIALTVATVVISLQAVGILLIIAMLIIPSLTARFWFNRLRSQLWCAGIIGMVSAGAGTLLSAQSAQLPTGATIVLISGGGFIFSMLCGRYHALLSHYSTLRTQRLADRRIKLFLAIRNIIDMDGLVRHLNDHYYLHLNTSCTFHNIANHTSMSMLQIIRAVRWHRRNRAIVQTDRHTFRLTSTGVQRMLDAIYRHELFHAFINLHPQLIGSYHTNPTIDFVQWLNEKQQRHIHDHIRHDCPYLTDYIKHGATQ